MDTYIFYLYETVINNALDKKIQKISALILKSTYLKYNSYFPKIKSEQERILVETIFKRILNEQNKYAIWTNTLII